MNLGVVSTCDAEASLFLRRKEFRDARRSGLRREGKVKISCYLIYNIHVLETDKYFHFSPCILARSHSCKESLICSFI